MQTKDLPTSVQESLAQGLTVSSEGEARSTVENYRDQIDADKSAAAVAANRSTTGTDTSADNPAMPESSDDTRTGGE